MNKSLIKFYVSFNKHTIVGDTLQSTHNDKLIILHGAGKASRERYSSFRNCIFKHHSISTIAFDMVGHGETGGYLNESSLKQRTDQVITVVDHLNIPEPLSIMGTSMGGYTAIKLTKFFKIKNLILVVPGIYHHCAYSIQFDNSFSKIIRQNNSWLQSDAFDLLESFTGKLLLISAEFDDVIPKGVIEGIVKSTEHLDIREHYSIQDSSHLIFNFLNKNKKELELFTSIISRFLNK